MRAHLAQKLIVLLRWYKLRDPCEETLVEVQSSHHLELLALAAAVPEVKVSKMIR